MNMQHLSDRELISRYQLGEEQAFEELLTRHKNRIYTTILMFVKNRDEADDLFQDTFIKIVDILRSGRYNDEGKFLPWALRVAYNLCVDQFRKAKRLPSIPNTEEFNLVNSSADSLDCRIDFCMESQETIESVRALVDKLPADQREVVVLRHFSDLSFKEIADMTEVSINTALGRMRYALINLRKMMEEQPAFTK